MRHISCVSKKMDTPAKATTLVKGSWGQTGNPWTDNLSGTFGANELGDVVLAIAQIPVKLGLVDANNVFPTNL